MGANCRFRPGTPGAAGALGATGHFLHDVRRFCRLSFMSQMPDRHQALTHGQAQCWHRLFHKNPGAQENMWRAASWTPTRPCSICQPHTPPLLPAQSCLPRPRGSQLGAGLGAGLGLGTPQHTPRSPALVAKLLAEAHLPCASRMRACGTSATTVPSEAPWACAVCTPTCAGAVCM